MSAPEMSQPEFSEEQEAVAKRCLADVARLIKMLPGDGPWELDENVLSGLLVGAWMDGHRPEQP